MNTLFASGAFHFMASVCIVNVVFVVSFETLCWQIEFKLNRLFISRYSVSGYRQR